MGERSKIEWTDHTFNPWIGCQKVSPACDHCYAESWDKRYGGGEHWGPHAPRRLTSDANWRKPLQWNRRAAAEGRRARVFCASLADVFDNQAPAGARDRLWAMIRETPWLEWQLLTKRVGNIAGMLPSDWGDGYPNVGLMITVVTQDEADRDVPQLLEIPAAWRGLSCEPLLGPIEIRGHRESCGDCDPCIGGRPESCAVGSYFTGALYPEGITLVITGGESGPGARPMHPDWARSIRDQCGAADVAYFLKQWGEWQELPPGEEVEPWLDAGKAHWVPEQGPWLVRVGKKRAGRMLDGRTWDEMPPTHQSAATAA